MTMRVTTSQMMSTFLQNLGRTQSRMSELQDQLSSGKAFQTAGDDPYGAARLLDIDAQIDEAQRYQQTISDSMGALSVQDGALDSIASSLQRAQELVMQATNGTLNSDDRAGIAAEITQIKESIRASANVRFGSVYLFGGTSTVTAPYPGPTNDYVGTSSLLSRRVAPGVQLTINLDGPSIFGTTSGTIPSQMSTLDMLDQIIADLNGGGSAELAELRGDALTAIDTQLRNVIEQRTNLGATTARLEQISSQMSDLEDRLSSTRTDIADADMADAYMQYQSHSTMYQSALAAGARIMNTSLLDFLR